MKIKLWQFEYDFDKDDAKIVIPLILVALGVTLTRLNKEAIWAGGVVYYLLLFFLAPIVKAVTQHTHQLAHWLRFRCPYCKSRDVILQGYQGYHSDEAYAYHLCNHCRETSVLVNEKLLKATR